MRGGGFRGFLLGLTLGGSCCGVTQPPPPSPDGPLVSHPCPPACLDSQAPVTDAGMLNDAPLDAQVGSLVRLPDGGMICVPVQGGRPCLYPITPGLPGLEDL